MDLYSQNGTDDGGTEKKVISRVKPPTNGKPTTLNPVTDVMINCEEVLLPQGEATHLARVIKRSMDSQGCCIGGYESNPITNTTVYDVEFPDGTMKEYGANIIAGIFLSQCDADGCYSQMFDGMQDHCTDGSEVKMKDRHVTLKCGNRALRKTTFGWSFNIKCKDDSTTWVHLKILKKLNPVKVAVYTKAR